jgi:tripartite-type tricarboxylate transporter receptor subunit TctC
VLKHFLALAAAAAIAFVSPANAAAPARPAVPADMNLYRGKTITYIVATGAGGGYDAYARLIARYMEKYLTGSRILIKNVPGAGHLVGTNTLYASRPDGLTIGMFNTGVIYNQLLQRPEARFDLNKVGWIGSAAHDIRVIVLSNRSGFKSFKEAVDSGRPIRVAVAGVGSAAYNDTRIVAEALRLNVQLITGFDGNEGELSMLRGEVIAQLGAASSFEGFIRSGGGYYALTVSGSSRVLPGVPQAREFVKDDRGSRLLSLIEALSELGRLTATPPGVPANMLAALREGHLKALNDPGLRREARDLNLPIDPLIGEDVAAKIRVALAQTPESIALLRQATTIPNP